MSKEKSPKKEVKKLSKKDKKELELKNLMKVIKEEKYKQLGYTKKQNKEDYE